METPQEELVFEPYESEEDVLNDGLSFDGEFQKETIGWSKRGVTVVLIAAAAALLVIASLILFLPKSDGSVVISEAMTSNASYLHPVYGAVDWVELYNPTDRDVNLSGFGLTDELKKQYKYTFPEGTVLKSGEYLILYCTGGTNETDADPYCTGFALSQEGETLYLIDGSYLERDELAIPALETDAAYARTPDGTFRITQTPTPGKANVFDD